MSLFFSLLLLFIGINGCEVNQTKSSGGSGSSGTSADNQPAHGQATINLMAEDVFSGTNLNTRYWSQLEAYCKAGPTQLIIADMALVPDQFTRSIAPGYWASQMFALSSTYAGVAWSPPEDADAAYYFTIRDQINDWWARYINAILRIMQTAPQTTALIIINDEPDKCGARLGYAIRDNLASVGDRVTQGDVLDHWRNLRKK